MHNFVMRGEKTRKKDTAVEQNDSIFVVDNLQ